MDIREHMKINVNPGTIYSAVSTPQGIKGWWCEDSEITNEVGGINTLHFLKEGKPVDMKFKIDEMSPDGKVIWTCIENANPTWIGTTLTYEFDKNGEFDLIHGNFDDKWKGSDPFKSTEEGWKHIMHSLKSYCETGKGEPW